ncbi:MAG: YdcF family protein [Myxococcota bacterium]
MRARLKRLLLGLTLVFALLALALQSAPRWLPFVSGFLVTEDPLGPADVIVVLSGSIPDRPRYAAELYRRGIAPRLLCASAMVPDYFKVVGPPMTHAELSAAVLRKQAVPARDIIVVNKSSSTFEELIVARDLMLARGWKRAVLVSSPYHLRRIRLTWNHLTRKTPLEAILRATPYAGFHQDAWWRHEDDLLSVQNEYAKILYYEFFLFRGRAPAQSP